MYFEDDWSRTSRTYLLPFCCDEREDYDFTFNVSIDPYGRTTDDYFYAGYIPLNMVLDDEMVIRYIVEDFDDASIRSIVQTILTE